MEWQFWLWFAGLLGLGALCRVGLFLNCFAWGALGGFVLALRGGALENQLTLFLFVSLGGIILTRIWRNWGFDKSFRDRL